jgi:hypothetical protein
MALITSNHATVLVNDTKRERLTVSVATVLARDPVPTRITTKAATVLVRTVPFALSVSVSPNTVAPGGTAVMTINRSGENPEATSLLTVSLASSFPSVVTVPATLQFGVDVPSADISITGLSEGVSTLSVTYLGTTANAVFNVVVPPIQLISSTQLVAAIVDAQIDRISNTRVVAVLRDQVLERISDTMVVAVMRDQILDRISAADIIVVVRGVRYRLSDVLPLIVQPGQRVEMKVVAINQFRGPFPATIEIISNARNHPTFKLRINSTAT